MVVKNRNNITLRVHLPSTTEYKTMDDTSQKEYKLYNGLYDSTPLHTQLCKCMFQQCTVAKCMLHNRYICLHKCNKKHIWSTNE